MKRLALAVALVCLVSLASAARAETPTAFEFRDGDRVVLIGDEIIERSQEFGYLETLLTLQNPAKNLTFRNLGWSGDSVHGDARAGFGTQPDGLKHLIDHVKALKPTVLIVGYGMTDSFDGARGLPRFESGLNGLLDACADASTRLIFLGPIAHEDLGRPLPDPAAHNRDLVAYRGVIAATAAKRHAPFIDLAAKQTNGPVRRLTDDGIHPTEFGYWSLARTIAGALDPAGLVAAPVLLDKPRVETTAPRLPAPPPPSPTRGMVKAGAAPPDEPRYVARGLEPGTYTLSIDGKAVATADAARWAEGVALRHGPEFDQVEALRAAINAKNLLYFYRWRPQNETYLFGFRKHEQGVNAREIPLFDPLVEEKERAIARLRLPTPHVYELAPASR